MKLVLAALLAAGAIFFWESVAHMFTPLGEAGLTFMPRPDAVSSALQSAIGDQTGMYIYPTGGLTAKSSREEKQKAMELINNEMKTKPSGLLVYKPAGTEFNFGKHLAVQFLTDLGKALLLLGLLSQTRLASYGARLGFVILVGILAAIVTNIPYWNWYGFTGAYTVAQIVVEILSFTCAGLIIAWLYKPGTAV